MGISEARDLDAVRDGFMRWLRARRPDASHLSVSPIGQPATGLSSETFFVDVDWSDRTAMDGARVHECLVARLPPHGEGLFPLYDLATQGRVQEIVAAAGLPAVVPLGVELDESWVGAPFLLMPRVDGRVIRNDKPFLRTGWLAESTPAQQTRLHAAFLDLLAGIHRVEVTAEVTAVVPGGARVAGHDTLAGELERWTRYLEWAAEGDAPTVFTEAVRFCQRHLPDPEPPVSLLWGDVQLGNVLVGPDMTIAAVLDFEMASIGPAELDLAWHLVLHQMTVERCGGDLPGFGDRDATIAGYEERLGRRVTDLRWYEAFAALRSGAIMVRAGRLLARLGIDDSWVTAGNPTVALLAELIAG